MPTPVFLLATMSIAYAHSGAVQTETTVSIWAHWTFDPVFLISLVLAVLYLRGWLRLRRSKNRTVRGWRLGMTCVGVLGLVAGLLSPVDYLADASFTWHMVQHELLVMFAAPFLMLGIPFLPIVRGLPDVLRERGFIPLARNGAVRWLLRNLTRPIPAYIVFEGTIMLWHVPMFYELALFNEPAHYLMHFSLLVAAALLWWNVIPPYPFAPRLNVWLRMVLVFATTIPNAVLGATLTYSTEVFYGLERFTGFAGLTLLEDQRLGGMLMWSMGGMSRFLVITVIFLAYASAENRKELARLSGGGHQAGKPLPA